MRAGLIVLAVVAVLVIGVAMWAVGLNNQLVNLQQNVNVQWAQVQNAYQRRADLIPNLVETVKGFAAQERTVLTEVTQARASASGVNDPQAMQKFAAAQAQLSGALSRLLVTVERYPDLKSNQAFLTLMSQLEGTENRISVERKRYNDLVGEYNKRVQYFPGSIVAGMMGFTPKALFEAAPGSETAPKVKF